MQQMLLKKIKNFKKTIDKILGLWYNSPRVKERKVFKNEKGKNE